MSDGPELVVMVGLQGSGKSTWVRDHLADSHVVVSKDHWPRARRREARQQRVVAEHLAAGRSVVVDNTNAAVEDRAALIAAARAAGVPVRAVWLDTPPEVSLARNVDRDERSRVPLVGVLATRARFVPPTRAEGFDRVDVARPDRVTGASGPGRNVSGAALGPSRGPTADGRRHPTEREHP
ncbi:ATP-binding protein [Blastococcus haudaquaticus]|uniref:AAA domain-containing protein n=1 Tax=Blastococcus haudaquaticus TaxID=1938745 RepID=A0A286GSN0_9ACTN|nr:ATP-binding protein [Blastococcus haudaquaticus]SOD98543.1 AAA domain-containing protein [Blastococcus haudaquaticus]